MQFKELNSPMQLMQFVNEHDLDVIEQAKSYAQRYIDALKKAHDERHEDDGWYMFGSKTWGFGFNFSLKSGKVRTHEMYKMVNRNVNGGKMLYVRSTPKALETWPATKGVGYCLKSMYIDLREAFVVIGTTGTWVSMYRDVEGRHYYAEVPKASATLTDVNLATRRLAKGLKNHGFTE